MPWRALQSHQLGGVGSLGGLLGKMVGRFRGAPPPWQIAHVMVHLCAKWGGLILLATWAKQSQSGAGLGEAKP